MQTPPIELEQHYKDGLLNSAIKPGANVSRSQSEQPSAIASPRPSMPNCNVTISPMSSMPRASDSPASYAPGYAIGADGEYERFDANHRTRWEQEQGGAGVSGTRSAAANAKAKLAAASQAEGLLATALAQLIENEFVGTAHVAKAMPATGGFYGYEPQTHYQAMNCACTKHLHRL